MKTPRSVAGILVAVFLVAACGSNASSRTGDGPLPAGGSSTTSAKAESAPSSAATTPTAPRPPDSPADIDAPASEMEAADTVTRIERAIRDPATPDVDLERLGWEQQIAYRRLAAQPDWMPDVLATVPPDIAIVVAANVGGNASIAALVEPPESLPENWTIVTPPPPAELLGYYAEAEASSGIPWEFLAAINLVETRMGRIVGDSSAGAQGPMQFIPSSWEAFGEGGDVHDPRDAILAAGRYLAAAGGPGDMDAALLAYNRSDDYVDAVSRYASVMQADERAYLGYHHWQVTYRTVDALWHLPEGYPVDPALPLG